MSSRRRISTVLFAAASATALVGPVAGAGAVTRYAAPQGGLNTVGTPPCTTANKPCALATALGEAVAGDEVRLADGDYFKSTKDPGPGAPKLPFDESLEVPAQVTLHGADPADLPVLHVEPNETGEAGVRVHEKGVIRDVAIKGSAASSALRSSTLLLDTALAERVRVETTGAAVQQDACILFDGATLLDSLCFGRGSAAGGTVAAVTANSSATSITMRNVTAITTAAGSPGLDLISLSGFFIANVSNSILRGTAADLSIQVSQSNGSVWTNLDHTNWVTQTSTPGAGSSAKVVLLDGNQNGATAAAPKFVDAAAGDFRPLAGSPTIDAGVVDAAKNGPLALGGANRVLGASTDIGAFEFDPASVPPTTPEPTTPEPTTPAVDPGAGAGGAPNPGATLSTPTADALAPQLTGLKLARTVKRKKGTTIQFSLSEPASVVLAFGQPKAGRSVGGKCSKTTSKNRSKPRCTIPNVKGTLTVVGRAGTNAVSFNGRIAGGKRLPLGRYSLEATPTDAAGNRGLVSTRAFTLKR